MLEQVKTPPAAPACAHILLAEDDPAIREMLASTLRRDGHVVEPFPDGGELLAHLETLVLEKGKERPDLVVSDVSMPGVGGMEVLAAVRAAAIDVPFILITAFADRDAHDRAYDLGAVMLEKPFLLNSFRETVRWLVE